MTLMVPISDGSPSGSTTKGPLKTSSTALVPKEVHVAKSLGEARSEVSSNLLPHSLRSQPGAEIQQMTATVPNTVAHTVILATNGRVQAQRPSPFHLRRLANPAPPTVKPT